MVDQNPAVYRQPNQPGAVAEAKKPEDKPIVAPPLSLKPDEYASKLTEQGERAIADEEKRLEEKHKNEVDLMNRRHEGEKQLLADKRESWKKQVEAVKEHVAMWQRHADEQQRGGHEGSIRRNDLEQLEVARKTGYEVRQPPGGDRIITGFPEPLVKGMPWVRPLGFGDNSRLHPSL